MKHGIRNKDRNGKIGEDFLAEKGKDIKLTNETFGIISDAINKHITFWRIENDKIVKKYCSSVEAEEVHSLHLLEDKGKVCVLYPKHRALEINPNINISGLEEKYKIYIKSITDLRRIISNIQGARIGFGTEFMRSIPPLPASLLGEISVHPREIERAGDTGMLSGRLTSWQEEMARNYPENNSMTSSTSNNMERSVENVNTGNNYNKYIYI